VVRLFYLKVIPRIRHSKFFGVSVRKAAPLLGVSPSHLDRLDASDPSFPRQVKVAGASRHFPRELRGWFDEQRVEESAARIAPERKRPRVD